MPWVRFDDQFSVHRKVTGLSDAAFRLHVSAIFWCARNLTDGVVPEEDLEDVCARVRSPKRFVAEMVRRGAWHEIGTECDSEDCPAHPDNAVTNGVTDGWVIHDYLEFQPSKARVIREREENAARQKKWREQQKRKRQNRNAVTNGVSNTASNSAPSRPGPVPSRRDGGSVGGHVQEISQSARAREATRWITDRYRLTDQEAGQVIAVIEARAAKPITAWVPYLERMADQGHLADIVAAVMATAPPTDEPGPADHEPAEPPEPPPHRDRTPAPPPPPQLAPPNPDAYERGPALARQLMAERRRARAQAVQNGTEP
ncbi:hypothetical protein [Thermomonospora amylolytica]|uniref:hypothetical protein n=1 Tax=Thermomonospora amylolytica TaxID=1411117 RepID=UPI00130065DC|nr:hypothetical protein [Thermomonospora amylolytica]